MATTMATKPNILFITCHDLGQHLGCYGHQTVHSPALDELAGQGVRFENSFCTAPQCSPSRSSLHTGRYPHANGVMGLAHFGWEFHPGEIHIAQRLRDAGYQTALFGVQHVTSHPERLGYDTIHPLTSAPEMGAEAAKFLCHPQRQGKPFYLEVGFFEPHRPYHLQGIEPDESRGVEVPPYMPDCPESRQQFAALQGAIRTLDAGVGIQLQALRDAGPDVEENTWVFFAADHGPAMPRAKCTLYDPGIKTALLMHWPAAGITGGRVYTNMLSNVDVVPTMLDALGLPQPENLHGRSLWPLLQGRSYEPRQEIFVEKTYHTYYDPMRAVRTDTHKLILNLTKSPGIEVPLDILMGTPFPALSRVLGLEHVTVELYDLKTDPWERHSLAGKPEVAEVERELKARLLQWMTETEDPILEGAITPPFQVRALQSLRDTS
jgi:N-sulfoglucosamine sulfohydrolase